MKPIAKFALVAVGVTVIGAALTLSGIHSTNKAKERFLEIPQITSEEELAAALEGPKQIYTMANMVASGAAAEDSMGILKDDYLYVQYVKEVCEQNSGIGVDSAFKWEYSTIDGSEGAYASEVVLFDEYEVTVEPFMAVMDSTVLTPDQVKEEYAELVDGLYYPKKMEDFVGNTRYTVAALPMGAEVAMYATVGDGEIVMEKNHDGKSIIVHEGDIDSLRAYYGDSVGVARILIGFMFFVPMGLLLLASVLIFSVTGFIAQKNADRKKAAKEQTKKK